MLVIKANSRLSHIQKDFNAQFPFLKLEFFKRLHDVYSGSPKQSMLKEDVLLKAIKNKSSEIDVTENMTVSVLENLFKEYFGISAQVFRKSGNSWLETTKTDDWTLKKQNDEGKELSVFGNQ